MDLWKQRWADGFEITNFIRFNPYAPKLRHFIPFLFVGALLLRGILSLAYGAEDRAVNLYKFQWNFRQAVIIALILEIAAYVLANVFFTVQAALSLYSRKVDQRWPQIQGPKSSIDNQKSYGNTLKSEADDEKGETLSHGPCSRKGRIGSLLLLPIVFVILHFSYGLGSIWGLISLPRWWGRNRITSS